MTPPSLRRFRTSERGFTLIELLVVILVIGILAAIAIPMFLNQRKAAVDAAVQSDLRNAIPAVELHNKFLMSDGKPVNSFNHLYLLKTDDGVKVYRSLHADSPTALTDGYPIGDNEVEGVPQAIKDLKLSDGTVLGIFYMDLCHYELYASNQAGNEAKAYKRPDYFGGGYIYAPLVGRVYPERGFFEDDGAYTIAMKKDRNYFRQNMCN